MRLEVVNLLMRLLTYPSCYSRCECLVWSRVTLCEGLGEGVDSRGGVGVAQGLVPWPSALLGEGGWGRFIGLAF